MSAAVRQLTVYLLLLCIGTGNSSLLGTSNRTKNDPYPVYTALYPYTYLTNNLRDYYDGLTADYAQERFILTFRHFANLPLLEKIFMLVPQHLAT